MGGRKRKIKPDADDDDWLSEVAEEAAPSKTNKGKKAAKKPAAEQRVDATGKTVRYSASANQKTRERIYRALPGRCQPATRAMATVTPHLWFSYSSTPYPCK